MRINNLRINSFGKLENRDLEFGKFNLIYDKNNTEISNLFSVDKKLGNQFLLDQIRLDRDLLEKTFVINQNSLKVLKNDRDELIQKISNLIESGSEEISYEKLQKKLGNLQLENVGSDRSSDRPYNIAKEKFEKNSAEINYLKNVNDDKYVINKKISDIDEKIEINSEKIESVNIAKNKFKEFNLINEKIKLKEEYYDDE